jgi:hypothetical protein
VASIRQMVLSRHAALMEERSSWLAHWQDLSDYIYPRRFRYLATERNKGTKRNDKIINNKPTQCVRTLQNGMMSGLTSPARPWIRLVTPNVADMTLPGVAEHLSILEKALYQTLARSNIYNCLHEVYGIESTFATAAMYVEEDDKTDVRGYVLPIGQFCIAASRRQEIDTLSREFSLTVRQVVSMFGRAACSPTVQQAYDLGRVDEWVEVIHMVEPREVRDLGMADNQNMPWASVWIEKNAPEGHPPLRVSGYEEFPYMVVRWYVTGEDVYGSGSPGMDALGDCKGLQTLERRKGQTVDKIVNPPMKAPMSLKAQRVSLLPGDTTYVPDAVAGQAFAPAIEIKPEAVPVIEKSIREHENRIKDTFYVSLFMAMLEDERVQPITAREVTERHEEKMLQLGPTVERNEGELLSPLLHRIAMILYRKGRVPPPPPALQGKQIKVEYISIMAQAQKLMGTSATERFVSFVGSTSAVYKRALDLPNFDKIVRRYAEMLGIDPGDINTEEMVKQIRDAAVAQEQAAAAQEGAMNAVQGAQIASQTDMGGDTALSRLLNTVGGGAGPIGRA